MISVNFCIIQNIDNGKNLEAIIRKFLIDFERETSVYPLKKASTL